MSWDKEEVKEHIELEDVYNLLDYFDAEPEMFSNYIIARTICHGGDSRKLYYYENTALFNCFTHCGSFDIFELVQKVQDMDDLNAAVSFIVNFFNLQSKLKNSEDFDLEDYKILSNFSKLNQIESYNRQKISLPEIQNYIKYYPSPIIKPWVKEGISSEICNFMGIKYDPVNGSVLIPHLDEDSRLVGIRQRTLVQENEVYGKYRPARIQGHLCNHPLAFNLYGLNIAKNNIKTMETAIVVESEKSVLQYMSYFGTKSNICVAVCGSSISRYQFQLLLDAGVKEIVLGFDKDFNEMYTEDYNKTVSKIDKLINKIKNEVSVSVLFDKYNLLDYHMSPLDKSKEAFLYLWRNRIII